MKGLLYKSWLNVKPVATYYIIFVVVFFLVSLLNGDPLYFAAICVMIGVAVPLASMTSDDKDGWEKFAVAAGISRARFALGRYLFALLCQLPGWLLSGLLVLLCEDKLAALATVLFYCGAGLFAAALLLPLVFRLGVEKSRVLLVLVMVFVFAAALTIGILVFGEDALFTGLPPFALPGAMLAFGVASVAVSLPVGMHIFKNKDL